MLRKKTRAQGELERSSMRAPSRQAKNVGRHAVGKAGRKIIHEQASFCGKEVKAPRFFGARRPPPDGPVGRRKGALQKAAAARVRPSCQWKSSQGNALSPLAFLALMISDFQESCKADRQFQSTSPARGTTLCRHQCVRVYYGFQSTSPARGTTDRCLAVTSSVSFQSTSPARGTTYTWAAWHNMGYISIHVPREGDDSRR